MNKMKCIHKLGLFFSFFLAMCTQVSAQNRSVEGSIRDASTILSGVTITVKGTSVEAQSNSEGEFSISAPPSAVLVFSYLGYEDKEVELSKQSVNVNGTYRLDIVLTPSQGEDLEEVVIVGFGAQKKTNLTGSVAVVDAKQLENRPVRNATQALQGLAPGLNISQNNGSLESNPSINVRGVGTIGSSSSSPLILIDGSEGNLTALNPQDIESVSVLKDAGASSIYGSRAAFGVILVTTKSGKSGKPTLNYNNSFRSNSPTSMPKMMDSYTFARFFNTAALNGNSGLVFNEEHLQRILDYQNGVITNSTIVDPNNSNRWGEGYAYGNDNVDWFDAMYRDKAFSHEHNLSLNGGTENTTYYLSGNLMQQEGMMAFNTDNYDRYAVSAKINSKLSDYFSMGYTARLVREDYHRPANLTDGFYNDLGRQGWPTLPLYDPNGFLFSSPSPALGMRDGGNDKSTKDFIYQQLQLTIEPIKGWQTVGTINYRTSTQFRHWDSQQLYNHDVNGQPYLYKQSSNVHEYGWKENYYNANLYSSYDTYFGQHHFKGMLGFQAEWTGYRDFGVQRNGILIPNQPVLNLTTGTDQNGELVVPNVSGQYQNWATAGFFGRVNYDYNEKYLIEANMRYDASSRFRSGSRWGWFPSVSAGWNIAKESFFQEWDAPVEMLKLRASYGELGNQSTDDWYPTYVVMPIGVTNGGWLLNGTAPNTAGAPGLVSSILTWESINTANIGVDFALLHNKLTGSFEYFTRKTLNMVGLAPSLPATLGVGVPSTNNTDLRTTGFEATIGYNNSTTGGFGYGAKFLLSDYTTTVTRYHNEAGELSKYRSGQKLGEIWGYETIGIAKTQEEMDAHLATLPNGGQSRIGQQWGAGDIMYRDLNGDGVIDWGDDTESNSGDRRVIGNTTPRYSFGLNLNADYKNFDLSLFFQGVMQRDFFQGGYYFWGVTPDQWWSTGLTAHEDYFRPEGDPLGANLDAYYARPAFNTSKNQQAQTRYVQDASYIRLKNVQLGYTLPLELTNRMKLGRVRAYIAGENVWTGSKVSSVFDPETIDGGSDGSVYPLTKVWSAGLSVTF